MRHVLPLSMDDHGGEPSRCSGVSTPKQSAVVGLRAVLYNVSP